MTKQEWVQLLGKQIRTDTYIFLERMSQGESYQSIRLDIDSHRDYYNIKPETNLAKESTIREYLDKAKGIEKKNDEVKKKERKPSKRSVDPLLKHKGVYGIYAGNTLAYIGKTSDSFNTRFLTHKNAVKNGDKSILYNYIRKAMSNGTDVSFKILVDVDILDYKGREITNRDIESMELALITLYQPICNVQGRLSSYEYTY